MTDDQAASLMPHAIHLAAAVAHRDPDAVATALANAGIAGDGAISVEDHPAMALILCLADLVTDAAGAQVRLAVRLNATTAGTIAHLYQALGDAA